MTDRELAVLSRWVHNHKLSEILGGLADVCYANAAQASKGEYPSPTMATHWNAQAAKLETASSNLAATKLEY